jgi:hypothetical protein
MQQSPNTARFSRMILGLLCLMLAAPTAIYAYNGLSMRYDVIPTIASLPRRDQ